jgi:hypothetical protein
MSPRTATARRAARLQALRVKAAAKRTALRGRRGLISAYKNPRRTLVRTAKALAGPAALTALHYGIEYAAHRGEGGNPVTRADMKKIAAESGLRVMQKGLEGKLDAKTVQKELRQTARSHLSKLGKSRAKAPAAVRARLSKMRDYLDAQQELRDFELNGGTARRLKESRPFGTGLGGGAKRRKTTTVRKKKKKAKGKKKKGRKKGRKKGVSKKRKKTTTTARRKKGGVRKRKSPFRTMNVSAARAKYRRLRDVFDIA